MYPEKAFPFIQPVRFTRIRMQERLWRAGIVKTCKMRANRRQVRFVNIRKMRANRGENIISVEWLITLTNIYICNIP